MKRRIGLASQRGVSMIEVMVTILVMSVGLLGLANLQLLSLRTHQGAYERTQATNLAYAVADLARANRSAVLSGGVSAAVLAEWVASGDEMLPGADVDLQVLDAAQGIIEVTVSWLDERAAGAPNGGLGSFTLTTRI